MKNIKYQAIQTIKKSNAHIYDYSLSWFETGTSIKSGRVKLALRAPGLVDTSIKSGRVKLALKAQTSQHTILIRLVI
jgi:hypothetical protein